MVLIWGGLSPHPVRAEMTSRVTLKILTINVWSGLTYQGVWKMGTYETPAHRSERYRLLVAQLRKVRPDIICLQEANPLPDYAGDLARALGYRAYAHVAMGGIHLGPFGLPVNFREGEVILVNPDLAVRSLGNRQISGSGLASNWVTFHFSELTEIMGIQVSTGGMKLNIFNTHLHAGPGPSKATIGDLQGLLMQGVITRDTMQQMLKSYEANETRRKEELRAGLQFIRERTAPEEPAILAGDLNLEPGSDAYQVLAQQDFQDTYLQNPSERTYTWDSRKNINIQLYYDTPAPGDPPRDIIEAKYDQRPKRIDYIWVRNGQTAYRVERTGLFGTEPREGVHLSDHFGYWTLITFPVSSE